MNRSELQKLIKIEDRIYEIAKADGLDFCDIEFDIIPDQKMLEIMSYRIPGNISNWKYGRNYEKIRTFQEKVQYSLPLEVVINSDPSRAYLMKDNTFALQVLVMAHVVGHCFKGNTFIETINGEKQIEKIKKGDLVLTHKGRFRKVINIGNRLYKDKIKKVKIKGYNREIYVTPNHEFYAIKSVNCIKSNRQNVTCKSTCSRKCKELPFLDYKLNWIPIQDLKKNDFISFPKEVMEETSKDILKIKIDKILHRQHITGEHSIKIDNDFARLIGYIVSDGSIREHDCFIHFNINEKNLADDVSNIVKNKLKLKPYLKERNANNVLAAGFYNKEISSFLLNEIGHRPENKVIPNFIYNSNNKNVLINCLKGIFLGDGYIPKQYAGRKSSSFVITTVSNKLAYQIRRILSRLNIQCSFHVKEPNIMNGINRQKCYNIMISGKSVHMLSEYFFNNDVIKGNRTFDQNGFTDNDYIYKKIESIKDVDYNDTVFNIEVEEDNSYVLSIGSIVHNCAFFTMNKHFQRTKRDMINYLSVASERFNKYERLYGIDEVEKIIDAGHSIQFHCNPFDLETEDEKRKRLFEQMKLKKHVKSTSEFADITAVDNYDDKKEQDRYLENQKLWRKLKSKTPVEPTEDLLRYIIDNSKILDDWQKDVLEVLRQEGEYFWPQMRTPYMNEGFATLTHEKIMKQLFKEEILTMSDHAQYNYSNSLVKAMNPKSMNPYLVGSKMWEDVIDRWDKGKHGREYENCEDMKLKEKWDDGSMMGREKMFEIIRSHTDWFFMQNFLTPELIDELQLYVYVKKDTMFTEDYVITKQESKKIAKMIIMSFAHSNIPNIEAVNGNFKNKGYLFLNHNWAGVGLEPKYCSETLKHIYNLWGNSIFIKTRKNKDEEIVYQLKKKEK